MSDDEYKEIEEFNQTDSNFTLNIIENNKDNNGSLPNYIDLETIEPDISPFFHPERGIPNYETFHSLREFLNSGNSLDVLSDSINLLILHCCFQSLTITQEINEDFEYIIYDSLYLIYELIHSKKLFLDDIQENECMNIINLINDQTKDSILSQSLSLLCILLKNDKVLMNDDFFHVCIDIYNHYYEEEQEMICKNITELVLNAFLKLQDPNDNLIQFVELLFSHLDISKLEISSINLDCLVQLLNHFSNFTIQDKQLEALFPFFELKNITFLTYCLNILLACTSELSNLELFLNMNIFIKISNLKLIIYPQIQQLVYLIFAKSAEISSDCCAACLNLPLIQKTNFDSLPFVSKYNLQSLINSAIKYNIIDNNHPLFDIFLNNFIENGNEFPPHILKETLNCLLNFDLTDKIADIIDQIHLILDDNEDDMVDILCNNLLSKYSQ